MTIKPNLWNDFLLTIPIEPNSTPSSPSPSNLPSNTTLPAYYGWFSRVSNTNHHYYQGMPRRLNIWKGFGYTIGICTLGVSCWIGYHTMGGHTEAKEANRLKRFELATIHPEKAEMIFKRYPEELREFKDNQP
jgi:hypothetical protein